MLVIMASKLKKDFILTNKATIRQELSFILKKKIMKKILVLTIVICNSLILFNSCTPIKEPTCTRRGIGYLTEPAIFPDTVALGDTIIGNLKINGFSSCTKFNGFQPIYTYDAIYYHYAPITPMIIDEGCQCSGTAPVLEENYTYYPSDTGIYYFSYQLEGNIYQQDTVYVY